LCGILAEVAHVTVAGVTPQIPAELRLRPYLQAHLTFREIGEAAFLARNTVSSEVGSMDRKAGRSFPGERGEPGDRVGSARRVAEFILPAAVQRAPSMWHSSAIAR